MHPRTTRGSGQRATPCEGARSRAQPGSGQPPTPAAEGEAGWDSMQPQRIGEGQRNRGGREGSGKQCVTPAAEDGAPPPLCARATPAASTPPCFRLRKKKTVHSLCKLYYIILSIYLFLGPDRGTCYGVNVQVCTSCDVARDVREVASKASLGSVTCPTLEGEHSFYSFPPAHSDCPLLPICFPTIDQCLRISIIQK